ncbi:ester cyclase [Actinomycetospora aeridis]|uniref:Nuclear transport factor 2 family protein n=1 Tax=Actinomycetospora aeridis TaxID=3129231 RepID=A0ABU8N4A6_9PSEU
MTDLVEATTRAWNDRDRAAYRDCYSPDAEVVAPGAIGTGHEALLALYDEIMASYPDNRITVERVVAQGDLLVEESRVVGTNTGPLAGPDGAPIPATGRRVSMPLVGVHVVDGDRITSTHFYWDTYDMLGQLGLLDH